MGPRTVRRASPRPASCRRHNPQRKEEDVRRASRGSAWLLSLVGAFALNWYGCGGESPSGPLVSGTSVTPLGKPAAKPAAVYTTTLLVTVARDGAVAGYTVEFSRSTAGTPPEYLWTGTTDEAGEARIDLSVDPDGLFWRRGTAGYYLARLVDPDTGEVVARWTSIPIPRGQELAVTLAPGERANVERTLGGAIVGNWKLSLYTIGDRSIKISREIIESWLIFDSEGKFTMLEWEEGDLAIDMSSTYTVSGNEAIIEVNDAIYTYFDELSFQYDGRNLILEFGNARQEYSWQKTGP